MSAIYATNSSTAKTCTNAISRLSIIQTNLLNNEAGESLASDAFATN
jgi:hypothetical protein